MLTVHQRQHSIMAVPRIAILRVVIDLVVLILVGLAVLFINLFGKPFQRGFFCNDEAIKYPYHKGTVSSLGVALGALLIPPAIIGVIEISCPRRGNPITIVACGDKTLPRCLVRWLKVCFIFFFGAGVQQMIVDIAKLMMGRLRPYFLAVCNPDIRQQCTLNGTMLYTYVTEYTCQGADKSRIEEARLSFPSGHAALSFYAAVFLIMYLQCAFPWKVSKLLKHVLQFVLLMGAWFTSLTRISDYHHHWSDVLGGLTIGSLIAILSVVFISDLRHQYSKLQEKDQEEGEEFSLMACETNVSNTMRSPSTFGRSENGTSLPNNI